MKQEISQDDKTAELLLQHPALLDPLMSLGVRPGVGDETLMQSCLHTRLHIDALTSLLNVWVGNNVEEKKICGIQAYNILPFVDFMQAMLNDVYSRLLLTTRHTGRLLASIKPEDTENLPIMPFLASLGAQVENMLKQETEITYKNWLNTYDIYCSKQAKNVITIQDAEAEPMTQVADTLDDLASIFVRHIPQQYDGTMYAAVFQLMTSLRETMAGLTRVRTKIMLPMVKQMEKEIAKRK